MARTHLLIVGGGTAGWMTAALCARFFGDRHDITLVESSRLGPIGVGEGTTPVLRAFFDALHIAESEWMPACNATYKLGIAFDRWSGTPGFTNYFHPFFTRIDRDHLKALIFNSTLRRARQLRVHAHPDVFFYAGYLARNRRSPIPPDSLPFDVHYGYHFDAVLMGRFLRSRAEALGVRWMDALIEDVRLAEDGAIEAVVAGDGRRFEADFFIDCTGFEALLIGQRLKAGWVDKSHVLFNDRAVTLLTPGEENPSCHTQSTAMKHGWTWRIPLQNRIGNGYVYSSKHCDGPAAEAELRAHLGETGNGSAEAGHLEWRIGRRARHWIGNCAAVGLSQGFVEPLEATALALIVNTASRFLKAYREGNYSEEDIRAFNATENDAFDTVLDFLAVHYLSNTRTDTRYWRDNRENQRAMSANLTSLFRCWFGGEDLTAELVRLGMNRYVAVSSWYCIFSGTGMFPRESELVDADESLRGKVPVEVIRVLLERSSLRHESHAEALKRLEAPGARERRPAGPRPSAADLAAMGLGLAPLLFGETAGRPRGGQSRFGTPERLPAELRDGGK